MRTKHKRSQLILAIVSAGLLGLSGCEWDNSEDYENDDQEEAGSGNPGGGDETPVDLSATISGTLATSELIQGATICLDENNNGLCNAGEPRTVSNAQGEWRLQLDRPLAFTQDVVVYTDSPNTVLADSGAIVPWEFYLTTQVEPNNGEAVTGAFTSTMSTIVDNERLNLPSRNYQQATQNIANRISTNIDILDNYLDSASQNSDLAKSAYQRLARIVAVADTLAIEIDAAIPGNERSQLSAKQLNKRIFDQVNAALAQIAADVDQSLIEKPNDNQFDPEPIVQSPDYAEYREPPSTEPPTPSQTELERRIANATSNTPYFTQSGFETYPVSGARLLDFLLIDNELRPGQVYYEARRRIATSVDGDEVIMDLDIAIPRPQEMDETRSYFYVVDEEDCGAFDCQTLRSQPLTAQALNWTGFSFRQETIEVGHKGRQRVLALQDLGDLIGSSTSTGFSTEMTYREFTLQGLDGRDVLETLTGRDLPGSASWTFGPDTLAYTFSEKLIGDVILSQWPPGGTGNLCDSPGLPDASETQSCNLVYGAIGGVTGMPAETFAEALYPVSQQNNTYNRALENGEPVDAMKLAGPTNDIYVARMFGTASDDSGVIVIDRQTQSGWETLPQVGRWERNSSPFPRVELLLPDGFSYSDARIGFKLGRAYLFERQGYLRHGWSIPEETNLDTLFNRRQVTFAFSQTAFDQMVQEMEDADLLAEHPYFSAQIDEANEESTGGGGGQTE